MAMAAGRRKRTSDKGSDHRCFIGELVEAEGETSFSPAIAVGFYARYLLHSKSQIRYNLGFGSPRFRPMLSPLQFSSSSPSSAPASACASACAYACACACAWIYIYTYVYAYIFIYIYTYIDIYFYIFRSIYLPANFHLTRNAPLGDNAGPTTGGITF